MAQKKVSVRLSVEADNVDAVRQKLEALGVSVKAVGNDNSADKLRRSFEGLEGRLDPAARAAQRLARDTDTLSKSLAAGAVSQERYNQLMARSQQAHAQAAAGMGAATSSAGSFRGALGNLGAQIQDVTVQAQMGTSAFIIMAQQGPQIASAFGPAGAVIGAFVAIASVAAGAIYGLGQNADDTATSFTSYTKALEFARRASDEMKGASEGVRAALEAEGRAATDAAQKRLAKADAELKALEVGMLGTADAASAAGTAILYLFQNSKVKELRQEIEVLRGTLGQYNDGARDTRLATEQGNGALRDARNAVEDYRESLRQQIAEAKLTADAEDLSSAGKLRARLETEALTKARAAGRVELDAGTRALIDELVRQQERIDQLQEDEKASNKAGTAAETLAKQRARVVAELDRDAEAQKRLAEIAGLGAAEQRAANEATRIAAELAKAHTTESTAEGRAIAAKVREAERWKAVAADTRTLSAAKDALKYAQDELALNSLLSGARERAVRSLQIQREATERWGEATSDVRTTWIDLQERLADTQAIKKFQDDVQNTAKEIGKDISENLWDQITGEAKAGDALTFFKNWIKRLGVEFLNANLILPITASIVGTAPSLFGISTPSGGTAGSAAQGGLGVGDLGPAANVASLARSGWSIFNGGAGLAATQAAGSFATSGFGSALGLSQSAVGVIPEAVAGDMMLTGAGNTLVGTAGTIGAAMPYGAIGGIAGGLIGTAANSKAVGALSGAALGAGAAGVGAGIWGMGAVGGPWGIAAAAIISAVMGALGTTKASVGPNAQGHILYEEGRFVQGPSAADNGGDDSNVKTVTASIATGFNALADSYGLTLTERNYGYWEGGTDKATGIGVHNDPNELVRQIVRDGVSAADPDSNVAKALASDAARNVADLETLQKYLDVAAKIDNATAAFAAMSKTLDQVQASAKAAAAEGFKPIDEEIGTADTIGLGTEYRNSLEQSIRSTFEGAAESWTVWETTVAQTNGELEAQIEAVQRWGLAISESELRANNAVTMERLRAQALAEYDATLYSAQGRGYLTTLAGITDSRDTVRRNLAAVGVEDSAGKADTLVTAQLTSALSGLGLGELADAARTLGGEVGTLAESLRTAAQATATEDLTVRTLKAQGRADEASALELSLTRQRAYAQAVKDGYDATYLASLKHVQGLESEAAAKERAAAAAAYEVDLQSRLYTAVGEDRNAGLLRLQAQQASELAQARANGRDTTLLLKVQAEEYAAKAFELAQRDVTGALDQQIAATQDYIATLSQGAVKLAQSAQQFRQAYDALAINDNSPLNALDRLKEARRQAREDYGTYRSATATDAEREQAKQDLLAMAPTLVQLAKGYFGSTNSDDYDWMRSILAELGDTRALGVDTAQSDLEVAQNQLKELQQARKDAAALGQKQYGKLEDLYGVMNQSFAVLQGFRTPLEQLTGTRSNATLEQMLAGLSKGTLDGIVTWAKAQGPGTLQKVLQAADQQLGWAANPHRYTASADVAGLGGVQSAEEWLSVLRSVGYSGAGDAWEVNSWLAAHGKAGDYETAMRAWAKAHGVTGFAAGGIIPRTRGSTPGVDSVPLLGMPGEGIVNLTGMGVLGADGLAALNSGRWPANDRAGGKVAAFRSADTPAGSGNGAAILSELRRQSALLERLIAATEDGDADNAAATREGASALTKALGARTGRDPAPVGVRPRTANG